MATILAMDTSATPVSCAVVRDGRVVYSCFAHNGSVHSQTLMPMVDKALDVAGIAVGELDAIAVSAGPGSFTGVRIGVSAVKGISFTGNIPCVSVSTLEAMAKNVSGLPFDGVVCCVMDARCQQVYMALFELGTDGQTVRLTPDQAISIEELKKTLKKLEKSVILVGDGSDLCYNILKSEIRSLFLSPLSIRYQNAVGVAQVAVDKLRDGDTLTGEELQPVYLRLPQAERELRARQQQEK
ncbi:MAG: tRNA (adenosine(37)-N6)-threonylcarbamoyltransferase complex dimerization subunit type 1 TsaB [Ruminococcaceae bacterium]|nr:tRNA (adenosine(37)-N6)-threonylcarbamoyltransferase complex dimerization subunit type 1 TsaB [Oscillospiraceae bacterium]